MKIGIVGWPQSGKTTLLTALAGRRVSVVSSGAGKTRHEESVATVAVPDPRIDFLTAAFKPKKTTHAQITFVDVGGFTYTSNALALSTDAATELAKCEALLHVVRCFDDPASVHPAGSIDPVRDHAAIEAEMVFGDLVRADKRLERLKKEGKPTPEREVVERVHAHLSTDKPLHQLGLDEAQWKLVAGLGFVSVKPILVVLDVNEANLTQDSSPWASALPNAVALCARVEAEIADLAPEEQAEFLAGLGIRESARDRVIHEAYRLLGLQAFFTVGEDEVRAWTIKRGTVARGAAGKIHSDLERGFIRAEVLGYEDFVKLKDMVRAKETGALRVEGKDYIVADGDILNIRFNV